MEKSRCDNAIEILNLSKYFGYFPAIRNISLDIKRAECLAIFGPNGAGKTTLIKIISTLIRPSSGTVKILGFDTVERGEDVRKYLGVVTHSTLLYNSLTAYENLKFYSKLYGIKNPEDMIRSLINLVGLERRANEQLRIFSYGMRKRLSIARALIHDPEIILFDEPFSGLDKEAIDRLHTMLEKLKGEGKTIIITTHDIEQGLKVCDMVSIIVAGEIEFYGNTPLSLSAKGRRWMP